MKKLRDLKRRVDEMIDKYGESSPVHYSVYGVDSVKHVADCKGIKLTDEQIEEIFEDMSMVTMGNTFVHRVELYIEENELIEEDD